MLRIRQALYGLVLLVRMTPNLVRLAFIAASKPVDECEAEMDAKRVVLAEMWLAVAENELREAASIFMGVNRELTVDELHQLAEALHELRQESDKLHSILDKAVVA
jgi:hypothetical protein